jgi:aminoglycoside 6'-N-acetyltransferase
VELLGRHVTLRPATLADTDALTAILAEPDVARWWGRFERPRVEAELTGARADADTVLVFAIELEGRVVGAIQASEEPEPDYRHAGIDLFLDPTVHGRGLGPDAIGALATYLFEERGHHRLTIDPAAANERAIRAYERVGFRPVGIMRRYERGPDGTWHDSLLMDLLAGELRG